MEMEIAIWTIAFIDSPIDTMEEHVYTSPFPMNYKQAILLACKWLGIEDIDIKNWTIYSRSEKSEEALDLTQLRCLIEAENAEPRFVEATDALRANRAAVAEKLQKVRHMLAKLEDEFAKLEPLQPINNDLVF